MSKLVVGNWKLHFDLEESVSLAKEIGAGNKGNYITGVAPVFTSLASVCKENAGSKLRIYAQNCHWENSGAFTGAISPRVLKNLGCHGVIIGHSERRHVFGETDEMISKKVAAAISEGLEVILCVGETLAERDAGNANATVKAQLDSGLSNVSDAGIERLVVAYEPVWAIGTGKTATPEIAQAMHQGIRAQLIAWNNKAKSVSILYGGSVKPANCKALLSQPDIDGALVGGASLKADTFLPIVNSGHIAK